MSTTLRTDVTPLYQDPFARQGYLDRVARNLDAFNEAARGAITFRNDIKPGDYDYEGFIKNLGGIVSRQDLTSTSGQTPKKFTADQHIKVKLHRKVDAVDSSEAAAAIAGFDMDAFAMAYGQQAAEDQRVDMIDSALAAARAALKNAGGANYLDATSGSLTTTTLVTGLSKFGDQFGRIALFAMHSKSFFDLFGYQVAPANNGDLIANTVIVNGGPVTLNKPILVVDSPSLKVTTGSGTAAVTQYFILALTPNAIQLELTRGERFIRDLVSGGEQIIERLQGEYAFNLGLKGYKWDTTNGGLNPTAAALGTGTNWDAIFTDAKNAAGVAIEVD